MSLAVVAWLAANSVLVAAAAATAIAWLAMRESGREQASARLADIQYTTGAGFSALLDGGRRVEFRIKRAFVLPWAVFTTLAGGAQGGARFDVAITPDSAGADAFRRLCIRLRNDGPGSPA